MEEGRKLQWFTRTAKDPVRLWRAIVVLMSGQGQRDSGVGDLEDLVFDADWIAAQNRMEYPFALSDALAHKFGYRDPDPAVALARYTAEAHKFSLVDSGVLDTPSCRLLVINGMEDSIFPIEDSIIAATRSANKDLLARGNRGHMGNPGAEEILYDWIDEAVDGVL